MSKEIKSPVDKWPGTVTLSDPLTFPQVVAFESALKTEIPENAFTFAANARLLPGVCACVEKWELDGLGQLNADNFPASPARPSALLISWLVKEITALLTEGEGDPNE